MHSLLEKTIVLVGIYNQQFQGTIFLMVFDFQGFTTVDGRNPKQPPGMNKKSCK